MSAMLAGAEKRASDALGRTQQLLQREASLVEVRTRVSLFPSCSSAPAMGLNRLGLRVAQETAALHERLDRAKVEQGRAEREVVRLTRELAVAGRGAA